MSGSRQLRHDLQASLGARSELGEEYEPAIVEGFLERLEDTIDERVDARVDSRVSQRMRRAAETGRGWSEGATLAVASMGLGIPLSGIGGGTGGLAGLIAVWTGITAVNVAHALGRRHRD